MKIAEIAAQRHEHANRIIHGVHGALAQDKVFAVRVQLTHKTAVQAPVQDKTPVPAETIARGAVGAAVILIFYSAAIAAVA